MNISIYAAISAMNESEETFKKIPKSPKPLDGFIPKGKKRGKKDYSKERERKREFE